jgi:hypothetical protein
MAIATQAGAERRPVLDIVHASPGRIRLREPSNGFIARGHRAFDAARERLEELDGVDVVRFVDLARSIVVEFDPEERTVESVLGAIEAAGVALETPSEPQLPHMESASSIGDAIADAGSRADLRLSQVSGHTLDMRTVMPLTFVALAARAWYRGPRQGPEWHQLLWWAFDSFTKLRNPRET